MWSLGIIAAIPAKLIRPSLPSSFSPALRHRISPVPESIVPFPRKNLLSRQPMIAIAVSIPTPLDRYLSHSDPELVGISIYIDRGAELVTPAAIEALRTLRQPMQAKVEALVEPGYLRHRIELLMTYFEEACRDGHADSPAHRDTAFALLYFLKGFDRIPDSVPEVGLLDDAIIIQTVLQRHSIRLRAHWLRHHRAWPAEL